MQNFGDKSLRECAHLASLGIIAVKVADGCNNLKRYPTTFGPCQHCVGLIQQLYTQRMRAGVVADSMHS
jgi:hypothetical protein